MNKDMIKKAVANKLVDMAVQTAKMSSNICWFTFGKPKAMFDLTSDDYDGLAPFVKYKRIILESK